MGCPRRGRQFPVTSDRRRKLDARSLKQSRGISLPHASILVARSPIALTLSVGTSSLGNQVEYVHDGIFHGTSSLAVLGEKAKERRRVLRTWLATILSTYDESRVELHLIEARGGSSLAPIPHHFQIRSHTTFSRRGGLAPGLAEDILRPAFQVGGVEARRVVIVDAPQPDNEEDSEFPSPELESLLRRCQARGYLVILSSLPGLFSPEYYLPFCLDVASEEWARSCFGGAEPEAEWEERYLETYVPGPHPVRGRMVFDRRGCPPIVSDISGKRI